MGGEVVAEIYEGQRVYDLVVRLPLEWRESPDRLSNLYVDTLSGQRVPLSYVAEIHQATGPNTILRENTLRRFRGIDQSDDGRFECSGGNLAE